MSFSITRLAKIVIFLGSFLGFAVQPMIGRTLLPLFGGTATVWVICLATFQVLLLGGYYYAHCLSHGKWRNVHIGLLGLAVIWTGVVAACRREVAGIVDLGNPILSVLLCVIGLAGITYILLSANSTLIQAWLVQAEQKDEPKDAGSLELKLSMSERSDVFHLYAISNAGSLFGLLSYPFLIEPFFSVTMQWYGFAVLLGLYTVILALLKMGLGKRTCEAALSVKDPETLDANPKVQSTFSWLWIFLPASSCFLLNAMTTHLTTDVTPIPLLWVLLLAAFLCSYIVGFSAVGEKKVTGWCIGALLTLIGCAYYVEKGGFLGFVGNVAFGLCAVVVCGIFLHGWLYRIRPKGADLTHFYLCLALGGAFGGVSSGIVAPLLLKTAWEYVFILMVIGGFCGLWIWLERIRLEAGLVWVAMGAVGFIFFCGVKANLPINKGSTRVFAARSFYGCLSVSTITGKTRQTEIPISGLVFSYGGTTHGTQYQEHYLRNRPTTYYGPLGGGFALHQHSKYETSEPMRVGIVGLGVGTLACWGRTNDTYRFYEINPQVVDIACNTNYFTYLADSSAKIELAVGDARILLAQEQATNAPPYDVLVIDAYSGDATPYHLATAEAFSLYMNRVTTNGILALHISNWHMDLTPLCKAVAKEWNLHALNVLSDQNGLCFGASWVLLSRTPLSIGSFPVRELNWNLVRDIPLPHDEKGSVLRFIRIMSKPPMREQVIDLNDIYNSR